MKRREKQAIKRKEALDRQDRYRFNNSKAKRRGEDRETWNARQAEIAANTAAKAGT